VTQLDQVFVYDYNMVPGQNFQIYYNGQAANAILPQTQLNPDGTQRVTASPDAGLTNAQAWAKYGIADAGAIAPSSATTEAGIVGLVTPV
jgi:hypothetical protein